MLLMLLLLLLVTFVLHVFVLKSLHFVLSAFVLIALHSRFKCFCSHCSSLSFLLFLLLVLGFRSWCSCFYHPPPPLFLNFVAITPLSPCSTIAAPFFILPLLHLLLVLLAFPSLSWCCHHPISNTSLFPSLATITFLLYWCCHHLKP